MRRAVMSSRSVLAAAVSVVLLVAVTACGSKPSAKPAVTTAKPAVTTTTVAPPTTTTTTPPATVGPPSSVFPYQPLFPFANLTEVAAWQDGYRSGGHQPWHLDAGETALAFARFLGYTNVDRVVSQRTDGTGAHVSVGFTTEGAHTGTAAVVHLVRYGLGNDAPWEVVGTDDTDFSLTIPAYGAIVSSPLRAGGTITGVDESIRVAVTQLHSNGHLGETCCVPAGGMKQPWGATVSFAHPTDPVLIVSASTGGHVAAVERFAVTGVRAA